MTDPSCVIIGNFDGVHRGHAALVREARNLAGGGGRVVALCFDPHPLVQLRPEAAPPSVSRFDQRRAWLTELGVDVVRRLEPTPELLDLEPEAFIDRLVREYGPAGIVEGPDFRFGRMRRGDVAMLERLGAIHGFETRVVPAVETDLIDQSRVRVSSTLVRWLVARGRVEDAARLLGRPFTIEGRVVQGDQRGRDLGTPTANLEPDATLLLPADGIYAGVGTDSGGRSWPAAISVGTKPTFGENPRVCEAHLIGCNAPLDEYGWSIRVEVRHWMRDQLTYDSMSALEVQIERDLLQARCILGEAHGIRQ